MMKGRMSGRPWNSWGSALILSWLIIEPVNHRMRGSIIDADRQGNRGANSGDSIPISQVFVSFPAGLASIFSQSSSPADPEMSHPPVAVRCGNADVMSPPFHHRVHRPDIPASWIRDPASVAPSPIRHPCLPNAPLHCSRDTPPPGQPCRHALDSSPHSAQQKEDDIHPVQTNETAPAINGPGILHGN